MQVFVIHDRRFHIIPDQPSAQLATYPHDEEIRDTIVARQDQYEMEQAINKLLLQFEKTSD
jgi:hypothetical protein